MKTLNSLSVTKLPILAAFLIPILFSVGCRSGVSHDKWEGVIVEDGGFPDTKLIIICRMEFPPGSKFEKKLFVWSAVGAGPASRNLKESLDDSDRSLEMKWLSAPDEVVALQEGKVVNAKGIVIAEFQGREMLRPTSEFYESYLKHDMEKKVMVMKPVAKFSSMSEIFYGKEQKATKPNEMDSKVGADTTPDVLESATQSTEIIKKGTTAIGSDSEPTVSRESAPMNDVSDFQLNKELGKDGSKKRPIYNNELGSDTGLAQASGEPPLSNEPIASSPPKIICGGQFSISPPQGWKVEGTDKEFKMVKPISSIGDPGEEKLVIREWTDAGAAHREDVIKMALLDLKRSMPVIKYSNFEEVRIGNIPALSVDFVATDMVDRMGSVRVFTHRNKMWSAVQLFHDDAEGPPAQEAMEAAMKTLQPRDP